MFLCILFPGEVWLFTGRTYILTLCTMVVPASFSEQILLEPNDSVGCMWADARHLCEFAGRRTGDRLTVCADTDSILRTEYYMLGSLLVVPSYSVSSMDSKHGLVFDVYQSNGVMLMVIKCWLAR